MEGPGVLLDPWVDPEQRRLEHEATVVEAVLVDLEVAVRTLQVELDAFAAVHHARLGPLYARLDELDALIAEAVAARTGDPADILRAVQARGVVDPTLDQEIFRDRGTTRGAGRHRAVPPDDDDAEHDDDVVIRPRVRRSREAQRLYRDLARRAHPDLTQDAAEKARRSAFIARVNDAYDRGDVAALTRLSEEWEAGPDAMPGEAGDRTEWLRARVAWMRGRVAELEEEQARLESSAIGRLLGMASDDPEAMLDVLAAQLAEQVAEREVTLQGLLGA